MFVITLSDIIGLIYLGLVFTTFAGFWAYFKIRTVLKRSRRNH